MSWHPVTFGYCSRCRSRAAFRHGRTLYCSACRWLVFDDRSWVPHKYTDGMPGISLPTKRRPGTGATEPIIDK